MGSSTKLKKRRQPKSRMEPVVGIEAGNAGSASGRKSGVVAERHLIPLDRVVQVVAVKAKLGDEVELRELDEEIDVRWANQRLGFVRRAYIARVRSTRRTHAVIDSLAVNPATAVIAL